MSRSAADHVGPHALGIELARIEPGAGRGGRASAAGSAGAAPPALRERRPAGGRGAAPCGAIRELVGPDLERLSLSSRRRAGAAPRRPRAFRWRSSRASLMSRAPALDARMAPRHELGGEHQLAARIAAEPDRAAVARERARAGVAPGRRIEISSAFMASPSPARRPPPGRWCAAACASRSPSNSSNERERFARRARARRARPRRRRSARSRSGSRCARCAALCVPNRPTDDRESATARARRSCCSRLRPRGQARDAPATGRVRG